MARDFELDRLFEIKQAAYREFDDAKQRMNDAWNESEQLQDRYGSEVDQLKDEHDDTFEKMKEAFDDASRAFDCGDHEDARMYADKGKEYKAELPYLVERRRDLIGQLQAAREKHKELHRDFVRAKAAWHDAKDEYDRHRDAVQQAKEDALRMTEVPDEYQDDAFLRHNDDGSMDIFYGGVGEPNGPGHGHHHYDPSGEKTYQREPFDPHGAQNFVKPQPLPRAQGSNWYSKARSDDNTVHVMYDANGEITTDYPHVHVIHDGKANEVRVVASWGPGDHSDPLVLPGDASGNDVNTAVEQMRGEL